MDTQKELQNKFILTLKSAKLLLKYYQNKRVKCASLPVAIIY